MKFFVFIFSFISLIALNSLFKKTTKARIELAQQVSASQFNGEIVNLFNGGVKRMFSSLTWVGTLLYTDYDHYKKGDLNNWIYQRLDFVTDIDPKFNMAYVFGGEFLSVLKDDPVASRELLLKGLNVFPDDPWINYFLGYNAFHEFKNKKAAIPYFEHILKTGSKVRLPTNPNHTLAALYRDSGDKKAAHMLLCGQFKKAINKKVKSEYAKKIRKLDFDKCP